MKRALLVLISIGIATLACLYLLRVQRRARDDGAPLESSSAKSPSDPPLVVEPFDAPSPSSDVETVESARTNTPSAPVLDAAQRPTVVQGTIVVTDARGRELPHESGSFDLLLWSGASAHVFEVDVEDGEWRISARSLGAESAEAFTLRNVMLGGRESRDTERLPLPPAERWDLRVSWIPCLRLHVRSASTGETLEQVEVFEPAPDADTRHDHPGIRPIGSQRSGAQSPLMLAVPDHGSRFVHVRSEGYAWKRVEVLPEEAERVLVLQPGGNLHVHMEGIQLSTPPSLRLFSTTDAARELLIDAVQPFSDALIIGLPLGPIDVAAQFGDRFQPRTLCSKEVEIRAGETAEVSLELPRSERETWVEVAGTLSLPAAWQLNDFEIVLALQEQPTGSWYGQVEIPRKQMQLDAATGLRLWSTRLQPGTYVAVVPRTAYFTTFEVGEDGERDVHIAVPEPCLVRVRCVDEPSGADVEVWGLDWGLLQDVGMIPASTPFRHDEAANVWELSAPEGTLVVRAFREGQRVESTITVARGVNDVVLAFPRLTGLRVILRDGETRVPWEKLVPSLMPAAGQETPIVRGVHQERATLEARASGPYTLTVPQIAGYEPVPPLLVNLEQDVVTEHVVALRRRP